MVFRGRAATVGLVAAALLAPTAAVTALGASPAREASCSGSSCTGKDPDATGCDTAGTVKTVQGVYANDIGYELRHSSGCGTFWARMTLDDSNCCFAMEVKVERQLWTPYGYTDDGVYTYTVKPAAGGPGQWWTKMVANTSDDRTRACYRAGTDSESPAWGSWGCTGWH